MLLQNKQILIFGVAWITQNGIKLNQPNPQAALPVFSFCSFFVYCFVAFYSKCLADDIEIVSFAHLHPLCFSLSYAHSQVHCTGETDIHRNTQNSEL